MTPGFTRYLIDACTRLEMGFHFEEGGCFGFAIALHRAMKADFPESTLAMSKDGFTHAGVLQGEQFFDHHGASPAKERYTSVSTENTLVAFALDAGRTEDELDADIEMARDVIGLACEIFLRCVAAGHLHDNCVP